MAIATYLPRTDLSRQLQERVDQYFATSGQPRRDVPRAYLKAAIMLTWLGASYVAVTFLATQAWQAALGAVSLGLAMAGVGFNLQHDGNHGAFSRRPWVNRAMALALDLLGGTAYFWHFKHNIAHHTHTNIVGQDDDISLGILGRVSPYQRWYPAHRFQAIYMWLLYGLFAIEWQLGGEFRNLLFKRMVGSTRLPAPRGKELVIFWVGKLVFFGLAFGLPMALHPVGQVLAVYALSAVVLGVVLALVFQLAHCSDEATFRSIDGGASHVVPRPWVEHQVETTVDFARGNRLLSWYLGGLNFQIEHHLFPKVCHVHYPALAPIVEEVCRAHGVRYYAHPTMAAAIRSHQRQLRAMGKRPAGPASAAGSARDDERSLAVGR
jgi:linoleoyl-CoA desaturase